MDKKNIIQTCNLDKNIQILRGLAIIAVVFIHNTPGDLPQVFLRPFMNFGVAMFLFLSGMLSSKEKWNPRKRLLKVLIPYFIWTFIYVFCKCYETPLMLPIEYIKGIITGKSAMVMYYIFVYCEFTLMIPLIDKLAHSRCRWIGFLISPIEIIFMRYLPLLFGWEMSNSLQIIIRLSCVGWFTYFYLGYLLGNKIIEIKLSKTVLILLYLISIVVQVLEGYLRYVMGDADCGTQLKLSTIMTGVFVCLLAYSYIDSKRQKRCRYLELFGDCSFGIFFSHLLIQMLLAKIIPFYNEIIIFPFNAVVVMHISLVCVILGKKILGKRAKYLGL